MSSGQSEEPTLHIIHGTPVSLVNSAESPQTPDEDLESEFLWTAQFRHDRIVIELQEDGWIWCRGENDLSKAMIYLKKKRA